MATEKKKLSSEEIFQIVKEAFGDLIQEEDLEARDPFIVLEPERVRGSVTDAAQPAEGAPEPGRFVNLMTFCRDDPRLRFDLLSCISGIDYPDRQVIEVVYCLDSTINNHWLVLKVPLPRSDPRIPTLENVWRTADWQERETYDLLGVIFEGHHNLVRILCAEDWVGHPLRKDYVIPDTYHGVKNVVY